MMKTTGSGTASQLGFGAAMEELEGILRRVESEEIDIDALAEELKRAAELLELCRAKIRRAEVEVSQIVKTLEEPSDEKGETAPPAQRAAPAGTANLFEQDD
jgi:exodeoxyribonuclease VII small subunit